jgi:hypothetical protein
MENKRCNGVDKGIPTWSPEGMRRGSRRMKTKKKKKKKTRN